MNYKLIGAILIVSACGTVGFIMAASVRREVENLRDFIKIIEYMECEINCRLTTLADLCKSSAGQGVTLRPVFEIFAEELEMQRSPNPAECMDAALMRSKGLSRLAVQYLQELGSSFGKFDLQGQLSEIKSIHHRSINELNILERCKDTRIRNCHTISLCIGLAMTILLL